MGKIKFGKKEIKKQQSVGFTLIALVITIIVLLVLAGVAISMLSGDNSILQKAGDARQQTEIADIRERAEIVKKWLIIDKYSNNGNVTVTELIQELQKEFGGTLDGTNTVVTANQKYEIIVGEDLSITVTEQVPDGTGNIKLAFEQIPNESKTAIKIKVSTGNVPTVKEWLQQLGSSNEGKEKLKDMYAAKTTHGSQVWEQCMSSYTDVRDAWEKQYGGTNGSYLDEYEMMIKCDKVVSAEYYIYLAEKTTDEFVKSFTINELSEMYAKGYTNGGATWAQLMGSNYTDLKDYYDKTKSSSGYYTDEYDYLIKSGFLNVEDVYSKYANTTFVCNGQTEKGIKDAEFVVHSNGKYKVTASNTNGDTGKNTVNVTNCKVEKFEYPQDRTAKYTLTQDTYKAIIPAGYAYGITENIGTISRGLVITDEIDEDGNSIGNEFVWIPIDKTTLNVVGTNKPMAVTKNGVDGKGNQNYQGTLYRNWEPNSTYVTSYREVLNGDFREPAYLTDSNYADESTYNDDGNGNKIVTEASIQESYNEMIASVKEYGGFYVARYEMGKSDNYSKVNVVPTSASSLDEKMWYGLYKKAKTYANISDTSKSVVSYMIWGSQYNAIINFGLTGQDSQKIAEDTNGNHTKSKMNTGMYFGSDSINNIYDLEGNMYEWTQEAGGNYGRVVRGGNYETPRKPYTHMSEASKPNSSWSPSWGTRISLYIK